MPLSGIVIFPLGTTYQCWTSPLVTMAIVDKYKGMVMTLPRIREGQKPSPEIPNIISLFLPSELSPPAMDGWDFAVVYVCLFKATHLYSVRKSSKSAVLSWAFCL